MSLYNLIAGYNELGGLLMYLLALRTRSTGRFRDCYLQRAADGSLEIHIYTRNGGPNAAGFAAESAYLAQHPNYLRAFDDSPDPTYRSYVFSVPDTLAPDGLPMLRSLELVVRAKPSLIPPSPQERMNAFMKKMDDEPNDPLVQRVKAAFAPIADAIGGANVPPPPPVDVEAPDWVDDPPQVVLKKL